jgi:hypothetical protein
MVPRWAVDVDYGSGNCTVTNPLRQRNWKDFSSHLQYKHPLYDPKDVGLSHN